MQILNQTPWLAEFTMGMDTSAREYLSLVVKGTFAFPGDAQDPPRPAEAQRPLVMADEYTGAPGFSAPLWETDFAFRKGRSDVILQGAAHAPESRPAERVRVGVAVGGWSKQFDVVGQRQWQTLGPAITATRPYPFTRQPFSYDTAFGGPDRSLKCDPRPPVYAPNPVGLGFASATGHGEITGLPLPNTEDPADPVASPFGRYRPMALGPIGRAWPERRRYAGTYDEAWKANVFPFLPADFDERYYQTAPADQQIDPPRSGTPVVLLNLTPRGREAFRLPDTLLPLRVYRGREACLDAAVLPDTLILDPEVREFMLVWRIWVPIRRIISEFTEAWIGPPTPPMLRAREFGRSFLRVTAATSTLEDAP